MKKSKSIPPKLIYKLAHDSWGSKEKSLIIEHIKKNKKLTYGENVKKFEKEFSNFLGTKYSVMVNSGGSANLLSIFALFFLKKNKIKKLDEIVVPTISWSTTYSPMSIFGLKVKFVDIDLETLNYDLNQLSNTVSRRTKVIVVVNLLGNANNFSEIKKILKEKKINPFIIEDNCESLGAEFKNKKTGSFGLISANSFYFSHHISTIEGGMLSTNSKEIYDLLLSLRSHGWTRDLDKRNMLIKKRKDYFEENFRFILPGLNLRPAEMNALAGREQLKKINKFLKVRRINQSIFHKYFSNDKNFLIQKNIGNSSWFGFSLIILNNKIKRKKLINYLKRKGIETRPIVSGNIKNSEMIKYFKISNSYKTKFNNSEIVDKNGFFVGNSHKNLKMEITYLKKCIDNFVSKTK